MSSRSVTRVLQGRPATDGGGVRLTRVLSPEEGLDPFLLLDEFDSSASADYIAGFPAHPHRGFQTVTYMLEGQMLHEDHLGNRGELVAGGVQWMTAGRGIIHSEMPQQQSGRMRGFQLWINLPAAEKMRAAAYQDLAPERIAVAELPGVMVKVVAGDLQAPGLATEVAGPISGGAIAPLYFDVALAPGASLSLATPPGHRVLAYAFEGNPSVGGRTLGKGELGITDDGDTLVVAAGPDAGRVLVIGGRPLGEPVVHYGPFVMNTRAEIEQALSDFQAGRLTG